MSRRTIESRKRLVIGEGDPSLYLADSQLLCPNVYQIL